MAAAPTAVVAGGGPVGAFAAIALAQQGWNVEVRRCATNTSASNKLNACLVVLLQV